MFTPVRLIRIAFIALVSIALIAPGAFTAWRIAQGQEETRSRAELRTLARMAPVFERLASGRLTLPDLPAAIDTAFEDQLVIRQAATQWINRALVFGFAHSPSDMVEIGRGGMWFRTDSPSYNSLPCASPQGTDEAMMRRLGDIWLAFQTRMERRGVRAYMIAVPSLPTVRRDNLPAYLRERCAGPAPMETLAAYIQGQGGRFAYDLDWFRAQPEGSVFDQRSLHWHHAGHTRYLNYLLGEGMLSELGVEPAPLRVREDFPMTAAIDLAPFIGVGRLTHEYDRLAFVDERRGEISVREWRESGGADLDRHLDDRRAGAYTMIRGREGGPRLLHIGDSFSYRNGLDYFLMHFPEALHLRTNSMSERFQRGRFDAVVSDYDPDVVVFLFFDNKLTRIGEGRMGGIFRAFMSDRDGALDN